jgi:hypothetical protein
MAVSIGNDGTVQAGAGTSIYTNIVDMNVDCPSDVNAVSVFGNMYIVSSYNNFTSSTTFQLIQVEDQTPNTGKVLSTRTLNYNIHEMVTLSESAGTFVMITEDITNNKPNAYVFVGKVDPTSNEISFLKSETYADGEFSVSPSITRLSDSSFAISYYGSNPASLLTRYG